MELASLAALASLIARQPALEILEGLIAAKNDLSFLVWRDWHQKCQLVVMNLW